MGGRESAGTHAREENSATAPEEGQKACREGSEACFEHAKNKETIDGAAQAGRID